MEVILGYERGERTTRNVIVTVDGGFARFCLLFSKRSKEKKRKRQVQRHETIEREKTQRGISRTYEDGADERVVQNPSDGYVGDAHTAVAVADSS